MSLRWGIGHFRNGNISTWLDATNAKLTFDIDDSVTTAEVTLPLSRLSTSQRNSWRTIFRPGIKFMTLCDVDDNTNEITRVRFAGFINKTSNPIGDGILTIQLTSPSEYMKTRFVIDSWSATITDPTASKTFEAASWRGVMSEIIRECFDSSGIPSSIPKPPQIIGVRPSDTGTGRKIVVEKSEVKSYYDLLSEVSEESGVGQEWKFVPVPHDTIADKIQWNVVLGTNSTPQINSNDTYEMTLDASTKLSAYGKTLDSSTFFTTLWLQSKTGDTEKKEGMDLQQQSVTYNTTENAVLFERYESLGVELKQSEMDAQFSSRMMDAGKLGNEVEITIEEVGNPYVWVSRLGAMLSITGVDGTISAGFSDYVRITNVSFELGVGTVVLGVQEPQVRYRKLPKQKVKNITGKASQNSKPLNTSKPIAGGGGGGGGGGTPTPPQPWEPGNPENPGDGGSTAAWGLNAGSVIGTEPTVNTQTVTTTVTTRGASLIWGDSYTSENQNLIQNESNILHFVQNFGPLAPKTYPFTEAPSFPVGLGLGQQSPTAFWSAFMQEGIIKNPTQLTPRDVLTDVNLGEMFDNMGTAGLWARPAAVEIPPGWNPISQPGNVSYFYVSSVDIKPRANFAVSIGGKIILPVVVSITWYRDNAANDGAPPTAFTSEGSVTQQFTTFFEASYDGVGDVGMFSHKANFGVSGEIGSLFGRAGSFILFRKNTLDSVLWSMNMAGTSGKDENCWVTPPVDVGEWGRVNAHFGQVNGTLSIIGYVASGTIWHYPLSGSNTAPVFDENGTWQALTYGGTSYHLGDESSSSLKTCFNAKPIGVTVYAGTPTILDGTGNLRTIDVGVEQSYSIRQIFCYRNYVYCTNGSQYSGAKNLYSSARLDYVP